MGINGLLPHLPGSGKHYHSFFDLKMDGIVPIDIAGALFQFAAHNPNDYLRGNHTPALVEFARWLSYLRSICGWKMRIFFDGMENPHKRFEAQRRQDSRDSAATNDNAYGQVRNTPEYIAKACAICRFLNVDFQVATYEADPQTTIFAAKNSLAPVTGDSDLLAYGHPSTPEISKFIIAKQYPSEWYRIIDLDTNVNPGEYLLLDLHKKHGRIVFQLYAGCTGCDFTEARNGIDKFGHAKFIETVQSIGHNLDSMSLACAIWNTHAHVAESAGFSSQEAIKCHLQRVVDIHTTGEVHNDQSAIVTLNGTMIVDATGASRSHMNGNLNSRTRHPFSDALIKELEELNVSQLIHKSANDASSIRGAQLPIGKTAQQCTVPQLRDHIACRGGTMSNKNKAALICTAQQ